MEKSSVSSEKEKESRSGLTSRTLVVLLYMIAIITPITIFMTLRVGGGGGLLTATLLIAVELSRIFGSPFSQHEIATILVASSVITSYAPIGLSMINRAYYAQSAILDFFGLYGKLPNWYFPPPESGVFELRTFIHPAWFAPIIYFLFSIPIGIMGNWAIGMLNKRLYIDIENLDYPFIQVDAQFVTTITERKGTKIQIFYSSLLISFLYGLFLHTIPNVGQAFGFSLSILPLPWVDFSRYIQLFLPGAALGIATSMSSITLGLILTPKLVFAMLIGSLSTYLVGNPIAIALNISEFSKIYILGMPLEQVALWSQLYLWLSPAIGMGIATSLISIFRHPRRLVTAFKPLLASSKKKDKQKIFPPLWLIIVPYILFVSLSTIASYYLVPDFPIWAPLLLTGVFSFILGLVSGRSQATIGQPYGIPYIQHMLYLAMDYRGIDAWYLVTPTVSGGGWASWWKLSKLTKTSFSSFVKLYLLAIPITIILSFVFTTTFWRLAPIPSGFYPAVERTWPLGIVQQSIWITRPPGVFRFDWLSASALITVGIYGLLEILHLPSLSLLVSFAGGFMMLPPAAIAALIGIGVSLAIKRIMGKKWFIQYRYTIAAGIAAGEGVAVAIGVAFLLISKSAWIFPF